MQEELKEKINDIMDSYAWGGYSLLVARNKLLKLIEEEKEKAYQKGYDQCGEDLADEFNPNRKKYKEKRND